MKEFRINGFEQLRSFYSWVMNNADKHVRPAHVSLYVFLLNQNNRVNWVEWFKCPFDLAMQGAVIGSRSTYYKCLDDLEAWGLIKYQRGINQVKAPVISLIRLSENGQAPVPLPEQPPVPLPEQAPEQLTGQLPEHIIKLITGNKELVISKLADWLKGEQQSVKIPKVGEQHLEILSKEHNLDLNYLRTQLAVADEYYQEKNTEITYAKFDAWLTRDPQSRKNPQNPNKVEPPYYKRFS